MLKSISKYINIIFYEKSNLASSLRFVIVGTIATGLHYIVYLFLLKLVSNNVSYSIGYLLAFIVNYYLTAFFTFKTGTSVKKGVGFLFSNIFNYGFQMLVFNAFLRLEFKEEIVPLLVFTIAVPINFILVRWIFKNRN
jgi:putative flippase GtrA